MLILRAKFTSLDVCIHHRRWSDTPRNPCSYGFNMDAAPTTVSSAYRAFLHTTRQRLPPGRIDFNSCTALPSNKPQDMKNAAHEMIIEPSKEVIMYSSEEIARGISNSNTTVMNVLIWFLLIISQMMLWNISNFFLLWIRSTKRKRFLKTK